MNGIAIKQIAGLQSALNGKQPLFDAIVQLITGKQLITTDEYFQFLRPLENNTVVRLPDPEDLGYCQFEIINTGNGERTLRVEEFDGTLVIELNKYGEPLQNTGRRSIYLYFLAGMWHVWERGFYPIGVDLDEEVIPGETILIDPDEVEEPDDEENPGEPIDPNPGEGDGSILTIDSTSTIRFNSPITEDTQIDFVYNRNFFFRVVYLSLDYLGGAVDWDDAINWRRGEPDLIPGVRHYFFFITLNGGASWFGWQSSVRVSPIAWSGSQSGYCASTPSYDFTWNQQNDFDTVQGCQLATPDYGFNWDYQEDFDTVQSCQLDIPGYEFDWNLQDGFDLTGSCELVIPDYNFNWDYQEDFDTVQSCELVIPDYTITQDPGN